MRWSFDIDAAAMYVYLTDEGIDRQVELPDGVIVDVDKAGFAVGVELLNPHPTLSIEHLSSLGVTASDLELIRTLTMSPFPSLVNGSVLPGTPQPQVVDLEDHEIYEQEIALAV